MISRIIYFIEAAFRSKRKWKFITLTTFGLIIQFDSIQLFSLSFYNPYSRLTIHINDKVFGFFFFK